MTGQNSNRMDGATTIQVRIHIAVVIAQHWDSDPGSDEAVPTDDALKEPRTREQHAATDVAVRSARTQ